MRLGRGLPFEEGAEASLWDKQAAVEAMRYPIVSGLTGEELMVRIKEEVLYAYIYDNADYAQVIEDYTRYICDYESMYAQCLAIHMNIVTAGKGASGRGQGDHHATAVGGV